MRVDRSVLNRGFSGLNPITYGSEDCAPSHYYGYAVRKYYLFHFVLSGKGHFIRESGETDLGRDSLFLIRPGERTYYQADAYKPWSYIWIGFDGADCAQLLENTIFANGRGWADAPQVRRLFEKISRQADRTPITEVLLSAKLYELMAALQSTGTAALSRPEEYVRRAADYMESNYAMDLTIDGIAGLLHVNRRYLTRIFTAHYGKPPQDHLIDLRLARAAELLAEGYPVEGASRSVGYEDVSHFSRLFKKRYGYPPSRYRKSIRK